MSKHAHSAATLPIDRADKGDGPGDDRADQQLVALALGQFGEVEMPVVRGAGVHLRLALLGELAVLLAGPDDLAAFGACPAAMAAA